MHRVRTRARPTHPGTAYFSGHLAEPGPVITDTPLDVPRPDLGPGMATHYPPGTTVPTPHAHLVTTPDEEQSV